MKKFYKSVSVLILLAVSFVSYTSQAQYCTPTHTNNCAAASIITDVHITGTTLYNSISACGSNSPVTTFSASGFQTCTLYRDSGYNTYTISVTTSNANKQRVGMWIDFNHDYVFDSVTEWFLIIASNTANVPSTLTFTVPTNAVIGQTEMRIRTRNTAQVFDSTSYCRNFTSGTTHRYTITIDSLTACSGTPTAGSITCTNDTVCSKINISFAKTGGTWAMGQTIQWQWSSDSVNWSDLTGDTLISILKAVAKTGYYRYYTSCGGNSDTSAAQFIYVYPITTCLCTPVHINFCNTNHLITNVSITGTGVNNTVSKCQSFVTVWWKFGPGSGTSDSLYIGNTYQFNVTTNYNDIIGMWIDFDHNAVFDTYEWFLVNKSSTASATSSLNVTIPYTADTGYTLVRIRAISAGTTVDSTSACKGFASGNTHDYQLYLRPLPPCTSPPTAGKTISSDTMICSNTAFTLSLQGNTYGSGQSYQWQSSASGNAGTWSNITNDTNSGAILTQTSSNYYRCYVSCGGNGDTSTIIYVGIKTFYDCYCSQALHTNTCDSTQMLTNVKISNTSLNNSVNSCSASSTAPHFIFSPNGNLTCDLVRGHTYTFNATSNINGSISAWLDYDQSGTFDSAEWTRITGASGVNVNNAVNITIPSNATLGKTGLRVRLRNGAAANTAKFACSTFGNGTTQDYIINIIDPYTIDVSPTKLVSPASSLCYSNNEPITVQVTNNGSDTLDFSKKNLTITIKFSGVSNLVFDTTITTGKLLSGATTTVYFVDTADMSTGATSYNFMIYTSIANDSNLYNDTLNTTLISAQKLGLNYLENFNTQANIPASYTANGFTYNNANGIGGTGSLRATFTIATSSSSTSRSPVVGKLTSKSALKFSYKPSGQMKATDTIFIQLSTDCGASYNTIYKLNSTNTLSNTYSSVQVNLGSFAGYNAIIKMIKMDSSATLYYVDFDNMIIGDVPDISLGNDTNVCDNFLLNGNPKGKPWDVYWSTGAGPKDTLTVYSSGSYIATATDKTYGLVNSDTIKITIYTTPIVTLGNPQTVCSGTGVVLDAGSWPAGYTYLWSTGDTTETITVYSSNTYIVTVNNPGGCFGKDSVKITVINKPQGVNLYKSQKFSGQFNLGTSTTPDAGCIGSNVSYDITPPSAYTNAQYGSNWDITTSTIKTLSGNNPTGTISITFPGANNGNINYIPTGADVDSVFVLTLTVRDKSSGCDTTLNRYIIVHGNPIVNIGNDQTVCPGTIVNFSSSNSFVQYLWSNGDTANNISPNSAGIYWLKATDTNGCSNFDSAVLYNYTLPKVDIGNDQTVCPGGSGTFISTSTWPKYLWSDGSNGNQITTSAAGTYWMKATDSNGCSNTDTVNLYNFNLPKVDIGNDQTICPEGTATFNSIGTWPKYLWSDGSTNNQITTSIPGIYWLKATDSNGCSNTDSAKLSLYNSPTVNLGPDKGICPGTSIILDGGTASSYNWSTGMNTQTINANTIGMYWLEITDANGCKGKDSINISILPKPKATYTYVKNSSTNIQFTPDDITQTAYNWTFGDGNISSTISPLHNYSIISNYIVSLTVTGTNGCIDSSSQTILITNIAQANNILINENVFPNPYNHETNLIFGLTKTSYTDIELYDLYGRKISTIIHGNLSAGKHIIPINTAQQNVAQGIYIVRLNIAGQTSVLRIIDLGDK